MTPGKGPGRIPPALWFSLRAQWASGLLPLAFLTEISRPALGIAAASFAAGAVLDWRGFPRTGWHRAASPVLAAAAAAAVADLALGSGDLLVSVSLLVLVVQSVRFLLPKTHRDGWQLCAISFLEFLAAAASTTEIQFAAFLFLFLGLSAGAMWALHAEEAACEGGAAASRARPGFAALLLLLSGMAGFLMTAVLFVVTPRIGLGQFLRLPGGRAGVTGFSDTISLRDVTAVKIDRRVVARIEFHDPAPGLSPTGLYLRGATFARFDGTRWKRLTAPLRRVDRAGFHYLLSPASAGVPLSTAEIFLEPSGRSDLFVYPGAVSVEGPLGEIRTDGGGNYLLPEGYQPTRYRVRFAHREGVRGHRTPPPDDAHLDLPPAPERIRDLATRVTAGAGTDMERAELAMRFFRDGFRYSLTGVASSAEEFLFRNRTGYCEHYAAGLVLLLRGAGIPARVAAGYMGGEWNDVGKYLIVRQADAHAWTEAWIGGTWVTLDATPPLGEDSPFFARTGRVEKYLDWVRQRWNKYVVNYSLQMQAEAVTGGLRSLRRTGMRVGRAMESPGKAVLQAILGAALAAGAILLVRRMRGAGRSRTAPWAAAGDPPLPRPYARLLRRLAGAGYRKSPGTPFDKMLLAAAGKTPELLPAAARFLALYHRDRFGPRPLTAEEEEEARGLADALRRGLFRTAAK